MNPEWQRFDVNMSYVTRGLAMPLVVLLAAGSPGVASSDSPWNGCAASEPDTAIAACTTILRLHDRRDKLFALAHYNRANAHYRKALFERSNVPDPRRASASLARAIRDYTAAIRLDSELAEAWVNRGIAWYDRGDFTRASADASEAIRLRPNLAEARNNRSLAYHKLGRYDLAVRDFDETIRLEKNYGNALINRAMPSLEPPEPR